MSPDWPYTVAPVAEPLLAVTMGCESADPLLPEAAMPPAELDVSPVEACAPSEVALDVAPPELPPLPLLPDPADESALPPSPEPPVPDDVPPPVLPDADVPLLVAPPLLPDGPPAPLAAVEPAVEVAREEPVLPPVLELVRIAAPVFPVVVLPDALDVAGPLVPPVPEPLTLPELPDVKIIAMPPVPPPPVPLVVTPLPDARLPPPPGPLTLPFTSPVMPDEPTTRAPIAPAVAACTSGEETASPLDPDTAAPPAWLRESPEVEVASELPVEEAEPELPPLPDPPDPDELVDVPPLPEPPPDPVEPDLLLAVDAAGPDDPDLPPGPLVALEVPVEVAVDEPVLPPLLLLFVVAPPVLPDVVLPEADEVAPPVLPPVPEPLTLPELPDVPVTTLPPVPPPLPPPPPPLPELPLALPDEPEPPVTLPPPATPVTAVLVGELIALPELPECDEPVAVVVLEPLELVLEDVPEEVELPEEPPLPVLWEPADPVAVPPDPEPPSAWAFAAAAWI